MLGQPSSRVASACRRGVTLGTSSLAGQGESNPVSYKYEPKKSILAPLEIPRNPFLELSL